MVAPCLNIRHEPIRAKISVGGFEVETPFVKSFSINKNRGTVYDSFSATLEVPGSAQFSTGESVKIYAGLKGDLKRVFTGRLRKMDINPVFDKPGYYLINISGATRLIDLENKRYSRRMGGYGFSSFVSITGGPKNRPTMGFSIDKKVARGDHQYTSPSPRPEQGENSELIKMRKRGSSSKSGERGKIDPLSATNRQGSGEEDGLNIHDHGSMAKGGPAFGVYSVE